MCPHLPKSRGLQPASYSQGKLKQNPEHKTKHNTPKKQSVRSTIADSSHQATGGSQSDPGGSSSGAGGYHTVAALLPQSGVSQLGSTVSKALTGGLGGNWLNGAEGGQRDESSPNPPTLSLSDRNGGTMPTPPPD